MKNKVMYPCKICGSELQIGISHIYCKSCVSTITVNLEHPDDAIYKATGKKPVQILVNSEMDIERQNLIVLFANAMAERLFEAGQKHSNKNLFDPSVVDPNFCRERMLQHMAEGSAIDVAIYASFLWYNDQPTSIKFPVEPADVWHILHETHDISILISIQEFLENFANGTFTHEQINGKMYWFDSAESKYCGTPINLSKKVPPQATHVIVSF